MPVMKIEIDIIFSVASSLIGKAVILVIMYVELFKTGEDPGGLMS